ncbi:glycosyltransferase family 4 protein [Gramella sp. MT6]|uniref:glycosyltransferase family 4 protein n=1 Tax=Gramella sp. MT6 TaxID=2705471 RepID=UPI001C5F11E5|nr:glycosyltransferase family 4 protein [Gramella sp. MT6]QYA25191.1 glycosyltransferase family 4 protein [Gramella sp. MT6]
MPLKILLLSNNFYPFIGGIEVNSEILAKAFVEHGHEVCVLTWSRDPTKKEFPFEVVRSPGYSQLLKVHSWADIVFENNPCLRLAWPAIIFGKPSIVALNTWISQEDGNNKIQEKLKVLWLKRAKKVIAVSHALRKVIFPSATVIVNPYRMNLFKVMPEVKRTKDFVFLGRLVSDKGADMAIRAIYSLKKTVSVEKNLGVEPNLTIIGEGEERQNLEELVRNLELKDNVLFKGFLRGDDLVKCLNHHRFIFIPSIWEEPFGMVALEGMACGCLPIASDGGGLPEAVGRAGIIFTKGDLDDLLKQTLEILRNPDKEEEYRNEIKQHLAYHQSNLVTKRYLDIIDGVTSGKKLPDTR